MDYRIAKPSDLKEIVRIHYSIRDSYDVGIFSKLGKSFLKQYYKIVLNDKYEVVVCAEDDNSVIQGFCSASLNVEKQFENIKKHRYSLAFSALFSVLKNPFLLRELLKRYSSISEKREEQFITLQGVRGEYWVWSSNSQDSVSSLEMFEASLKIIQNLGKDEYFFEVDILNTKVFKFHKLNGAEVIKTISLPDGRERAILKYNLKTRKSLI